MTVTAADVLLWGNLPTPTPASDEEALFAKVLAAVKSHVVAYYTVDADEANWTDDQDLAVIMQTVRLWKRRQTPEGILEFDELGAVRVSSIDGDIVTLLSPVQKWGFA